MVQTVSIKLVLKRERLSMFTIPVLRKYLYLFSSPSGKRATIAIYTSINVYNSSIEEVNLIVLSESPSGIAINSMTMLCEQRLMAE